MLMQPPNQTNPMRLTSTSAAIFKLSSLQLSLSGEELLRGLSKTKTRAREDTHVPLSLFHGTEPPPPLLSSAPWTLLLPLFSPVWELRIEQRRVVLVLRRWVDELRLWVAPWPSVLFGKLKFNAFW
ncbi:unnamed protein product [Camellia sinensis]